MASSDLTFSSLSPSPLSVVDALVDVGYHVGRGWLGGWVVGWFVGWVVGVVGVVGWLGGWVVGWLGLATTCRVCSRRPTARTSTHGHTHPMPNHSVGHVVFAWWGVLPSRLVQLLVLLVLLVPQSRWR